MTQLSVLDQVPVPRGTSSGCAIRSSVELAREAEDLGYASYWFAEHHLDQGRASSAPAILIALVIQATQPDQAGFGSDSAAVSHQPGNCRGVRFAGGGGTGPCGARTRPFPKQG